MAIIPKGGEPAEVKKRMEDLFRKLDRAYPDKVICGMSRDHKKWGETVTELYRLLGYPDSRSFLKAYGYTVKNASSRPKTDHEAVMGELKKRYPDGSGFATVAQLEQANPDLRPSMKTLQNQANQLFGTSFKEHLIREGLLTGKVKAVVPVPQSHPQGKIAASEVWNQFQELMKAPAPVRKETPPAKVVDPADLEQYTFVRVSCPESGRGLWAISEVARVNVGQTMQIQRDREVWEAPVEQVIQCTGKDAPCPVSSVAHFAMKITEKEKLILRLNGRALDVDAAIPELQPVPVPRRERLKKPPLDLKARNFWDEPDCALTQLHFRGPLGEIRRLWEYMDAQGKKRYLCRLMEDGSVELLVDPAALDGGNNGYDDLLPLFPALKAVGMAEIWSAREVYAFYSESGADQITHCRSCGSFDPRADDEESRWACYMPNMFAPCRTAYRDIQTGVWVRIRYDFPWEQEWADKKYHAVK